MRLNFGILKRPNSPIPGFGLTMCYIVTGKRVFDAIVDLPFALPTAVSGIALTTLYSSSGWYGEGG